MVGLDLPDDGVAWSPSASLGELRALLNTVGAEAGGERVFVVRRIDPASLLGKGQVQEIAAGVQSLGCDLVVFDSELKPRQQRNLEKSLGVKIVDRTALILDIFASRAHTAEGKLQVERAQSEYLLPRLSELWVQFSRTGGGIGTRGPGETQIETDRRQLRARISELDRRLATIRSRRSLSRASRRGKGLPVAALVGYTNAGKSSLLNALSRGGAYVEDKLFATLDPLTRRVELPNGRPVLVTDTVGFIQRLPTRLVAAFRATLEEVIEADLLVHVVDISSPTVFSQIASVHETLNDLKLQAKPMVTALNKIDLVEDPGELFVPGAVPVSALTGAGLDELLENIASHLYGGEREVVVSIPFGEGRLVDLFHREGKVEEERFTAQGTLIRGAIPQRYSALFRPFELPQPALRNRKQALD